MHYLSIFRNWKSTSLLVAAVTLLTALLLLMQAGGDFARVQAQTPDDAHEYSNMDPLLNEVVQQYESGEFTSSTAAATAPVNSGESVGVIFTTESGRTEEVRDFLLENGASPGPAFDGFVGADVPVSLLADASQQDGVEWMQASVPAQAATADSDVGGTDAHGVNAWHDAGIRGEGTKIAVIHIGFEGIQDLLGTELPQAVTVRCYTGYGLFTTDIANCENGITGGASRAARVFDVAPEASYYIIMVDDWVDLHDAVKWMVEEEVDVVSNSVLWIYTGPGDGTSPYALSDLNSVDEAIEGGITWVTPSGNNAQKMWFGAFSDEDGDGFHEFSEDDECNRVNLEDGEVYMGVVRWEDKWTGPFDPLEYRDLTLQMVHEETSTRIRRSFRSFLARTAPLEYLYFFPRVEGNYCLRLELTAGTAPEWVQVKSFFGGELEHPSVFGSISSPAESNNPGLISVGVTAPGNAEEIYEKSSRGPAPEPWPAGRIKPEIIAAFGPSHGMSDSMLGTGWGAAYMAGVAALVKQRFPEFTPEEIAGYLKDNAEDRGEPGPDNAWGYGLAMLPVSDAAAPPEPDVCIQRIFGSQTIEGTWDVNCLSENRPTDGAGFGDGDYYARFFTFAVGTDKRVTVSLTSEEDTYLYLMEGTRRDGPIEAYNDDVASNADLNSRIVVDNIEPGEYTIEATTYHREKRGDFTLTVEITDIGAEPAPSASGPFRSFSRGADHVCALGIDGQIACWGNDDYRQASPPSGQYRAISSGENGSCALRNDGAAVCWGSFDVNPASDDSAEGPFRSISRGSDHACALDRDGEITCWGSNRHDQATPPSGEYSTIDSHHRGSCALRDDDALVCWGSLELNP